MRLSWIKFSGAFSNICIYEFLLSLATAFLGWLCSRLGVFPWATAFFGSRSRRIIGVDS
jgi:hypothetical protein